MTPLPVDVPLDPDADEARELVVRELAKPEYRAAEPTLFDRMVQGFFDWLGTLQVPGGGALSPLGILLVVAVAAALIGVAFLVFGLPRLSRRSRALGTLFGDDDSRDAASLRAAAARAAREGDWATAVAEQFRAIARDLADRTVVSVTPGTTARGFADRAAAAFPEEGERLIAAAASFDRVRYLGSAGSPQEHEMLLALDAALRSSRPTLAAVPG